VKIEELKKVETYLRRLFGNQTIRVKARPRKDDSAEVFVGEEFVGVIYRDDEDEELSYNFSMAILEVDLTG
jgi:predicted RNA-binding protein (virulence factor B family)